ncbi:MucBP domain-containing protein [Levilactobacillus wangkuiensis]|uniref:MucBP domain-containing protein n=1 Tax=Levilactobacillus wangkuiensis TaxID=2799566 RepID=UPI001940E431|nr:MucBP domain-containing protein [Levilactobacillus wangkuiensis]
MDKVIRKYKIMYNADKRWLVMTTVAVSLVWGILDSQPVSADVVPDAGTDQENVMADSDGDGQSVTLTRPVVDGSGQSDVLENDKPETESPVEEKAGTDNSASALPNEENEENSNEQADTTLPASKVDQDEATSESHLSEVNDQKKDKLRVLPKRDTVVNEPQQNDVHKTQQSVQVTPTSTAVMPQVRTSARAQNLIDNWMPNEKLQELVWKELTAADDIRNSRVFKSGRHWETAKDITQDDLKLLDDLDLAAHGTTYIDGKHSFSLEGLEYATNLKRLDVSNALRYEPYAIRGDVTDLTPLKNLVNLESLNFTGNRVSDITPITGLKNIKELVFPANQVADFSSLDMAQYTTVRFGQQFVEGKVEYIPHGDKYTMTNPIKKPQGAKLILQPSTSGFFIPISMANVDNYKVVRAIRSGAVANMVDGKINFSEIQNQSMPGEDVNWQFQEAHVPMYAPLEKYGFFLTMNFRFEEGNGYPDVSYIIPYIQADRAQDVTVDYINEESGKSIAPREILKGFIGENYYATIKEIAGYHHDSPDNAEGIFSKDSQTVKFTYFKDKLKPVAPPVTPIHPAQLGTVTVHYQTTTGTTVAPDTVLTGIVGDSYNTKPAANVSADYELTTTPTNASGVFSSGQITVTYVYDKVVTTGAGDGSKPAPTPEPAPIPDQSTQQPAAPDVNSGQPDEQAGTNPATTAVTPTHGGAAVQGTPAKTATKQITPSIQATLPKTNDKPTSPFWGMTILWVILGLVGIKQRKH